jgi:hypothetical protein
MIFVFVMLVTASTITFAQSTTANSSVVASQDAAATVGKSLILQSGTELAGELQNTIDVRKAKVGDQVVLKTIKAIKSEGKTLVNKNARLIGHVTHVTSRTKENRSSTIGLLFDRLENGSLSIPISATISSLSRASTASRTADENTFASARTDSQTSSSANSGGLLSGVTNTAGNVVGGTTSTVGSVVGATTGAVGDTVSGTNGSTSRLTRSLSGIQISQSTDVSASGESTLTLTGDDLKIEKGTNFNLVVNQKGGASATRQQ